MIFDFLCFLEHPGYVRHVRSPTLELILVSIALA